MRRLWTFVRLVYLYGLYLLVGLDEGWFQIMKGHYLVELGLFPAAARAYQKALRETKTPSVRASLGYAYLCAGLPDRAVEALREAYSKEPNPDFGAILAWALNENGDRAESEALCLSLSARLSEYSPETQENLTRLAESLKSGTPNDALQLTKPAQAIQLRS